MQWRGQIIDNFVYNLQTNYRNCMIISTVLQISTVEFTPEW